MYVATLSLEVGWLVRVDVSTSLVGPTVTCTRTDADGDVKSFTAYLGSDTHNVGLPALAILELIKALEFHEVRGGIEVAHSSQVFDNDTLAHLLASATPAYAIRNLATSATLQ